MIQRKTVSQRVKSSLGLKMVQHQCGGEEDITINEVFQFNYGFSNANGPIQGVSLGRVAGEEYELATTLQKAILYRSAFVRLRECC